MQLPPKQSHLYSQEIYDAVDCVVDAALAYTEIPTVSLQYVGKPYDEEAMAGLSDTAVVQDPENYREVMPMDTLALWNTQEELRAGMHAIEDIMYYERVFGIAKWYDGVATHESAHAAAARWVGFTVVKLGIRTYPQSEGPRVGFGGLCAVTRPDRPITKLAMASIAIAPSDPSTDPRFNDNGGDLDGISRMGYEGAEDVKARIEFFNSRNPDSPLPLPEDFTS